MWWGGPEWSVVGIRWVEVGQREVTHFKWAGEWVGKAGKKAYEKSIKSSI